MPNTVPAAAEGLPEINRRKALAVTGSGLIAALTGVAASTMPAPALPSRASSPVMALFREWEASWNQCGASRSASIGNRSSDGRMP